MRSLAISTLLAASVAALVWPFPTLRRGRASPAAIRDVAGAAAPPVALVPHTVIGYRRGRKVEVDLVTLGWVELEIRTARAFLAMRAAAARQGIELAVRSGFRTLEQQTWLYRAWKAGWGNKAARPGHSKHQSGRAIDIDLDAPGALAWLKKNARRFGFKRTVRGEPWHWEYVAKPKKRRKGKGKRRSRRRRSGT